MKSYKDIVHDGGSDVVGQVTEQARRRDARLASVRHTIAVMSGKGGVGKSSVTVNLAAALVQQGHTVGILDADLNGASVARMLGITPGPEAPAPVDGGIPPALGPLGLRVMSIDLFLPDAEAPVRWDTTTEHAAYAWRRLAEMGVLREFLSDTAWGVLDVLLIDLPPGTEKLPDLVDVLPQLSGAVIVTIPSQVSQFVVGKSIRLAHDLLDTPTLGLIENMSAYVCPCCGTEEALFPGGDVPAMAAALGVPYLGAVPFDPRMAVASDDGVPFVARHPETPAAHAFTALAAQVRAALEAPQPA